MDRTRHEVCALKCLFIGTFNRFIDFTINFHANYNLTSIGLLRVWALIFAGRGP